MQNYFGHIQGKAYKYNCTVMYIFKTIGQRIMQNLRISQNFN